MKTAYEHGHQNEAGEQVHEGSGEHNYRTLPERFCVKSDLAFVTLFGLVGAGFADHGYKAAYRESTDRKIVDLALP